MKQKFNFKLTAVLVSLFISLIMIIVGNKNQYCLSFGFMLMGLSSVLFVQYNNEKTAQLIDKIDKEVDEIDLNEELSENEALDEEEKAYVLQQLYLRQGKLLKRKKKVAIIFYMCAGLLVLLGIFGIF